MMVHTFFIVQFDQGPLAHTLGITFSQGAKKLTD